MKFSEYMVHFHTRLNHFSSLLEFNRKKQLYYLLAIICAGILVQLLTSIRMGDTDMWYHLSDGKYFWDNNKIPNSYFYSYFPQDSTWFDHFWGFQAIIFKIYSQFDYQGLLIFRSLLVSLIIVTVALFLFQHSTQELFWPKFIIFFLGAILILERGYQLRPHLISYFMIPVFLYFLEHHKKHIYVLPFLGIIWINTHAIEWVIAALICGAYFIEEVSKNREQRNYVYLGWILACPLALLFSHSTIELIKAPFSIPANFDNYINELQSVPIQLFYSINLSFKSISANTAFTILFFITLLSGLLLIKKRKLRLSHAIISVGSLNLLAEGNRFIWEWFLLNLPLMHHAINNLNIKPFLSRKKYTYLIAIASLFPFYQLSQMVDLNQKYPFNPEGLPVDAVDFLKTTSASGNLLIGPNKAGFIQQQLWPSIRIHSDMKSDDRMFLEINSALRYPNAMQDFFDKYQIDFFIQEDSSRETAEELKKSGFEPIYLESNGIIYAHAERQKQMVDKYKIQFDIFEEIEKLDTDAYISEINRMISIQPNKQLIISGIRKLFNDKKYNEALSYAEALYKDYPYDPNSAYWLGNLYENLDQCKKALPYFEEAKKISTPDFTKKIMKHIGTCNYILQDFEASYNAFARSMNIFLEKEAPEDIFQYAYSSIIMGKLDKARFLLQAIIYITPTEKDHIRQAAIKLRQDIDNGNFDVPSFFKWASDQVLSIFQS